MKKIKAYDIDGVLANFIDGFIASAKYRRPDLWDNSYPNNYSQWDDWHAIPKEQFGELWKSFANEERFWRNLPVHEWIEGFESKIDPDYYITSRSVSGFVTANWLEIGGFTVAPVITVGVGESKTEQITKLGVTHMLEDAYHNYKDINDNTNAECYLVPRPHNITPIVEGFVNPNHVITNPQDFIKI